MFKENQDSAEHPGSLIVPGKTFGFLRIFCALYNSVLLDKLCLCCLLSKANTAATSSLGSASYF